MKSVESNEKEYETMEKTLKEVAKVGGQGVRHLNDNDISWFKIYNGRGLESTRNYSFTLTDVVSEHDSGLYFVPTLFMQGAPSQARYFGYEDEASCGDGGLDWDAHLACRWPRHPDAELTTKKEDKLIVSVDSVESKVKGYLNAVGEYFNDKDLYHFEVGNEWERFPKRWEVDEINLIDWRWNASHYADLVELASKTLKEKNSNYKIILGGLFSGDTELEEIWFEKTIKEYDKGDVPFDIISFHHYESLDDLSKKLAYIHDLKEDRDIEDVPVWLTEFGESATATSEAEQVKTMVKQTAYAFGNKVEVVVWHTFVSKSDGKEDWGGYGIVPFNRINGADDSSSNDRDKYRSYYVYEFLVNKIGNFKDSMVLVQNGLGLVTMNLGSGQYMYRFAGALYPEWGADKEAFILWGNEGSKIDLGKIFLVLGKTVTKIKVTKIMPDKDGVFDRWKTTSFSSFEVSDNPYLIEIVE